MYAVKTGTLTRHDHQLQVKDFQRERRITRRLGLFVPYQNGFERGSIPCFRREQEKGKTETHVTRLTSVDSFYFVCIRKGLLDRFFLILVEVSGWGIISTNSIQTPKSTQTISMMHRGAGVVL